MVPLESIFADTRTLALAHLRAIDGIEATPTNLRRLMAHLDYELCSEPWYDRPDFHGVAARHGAERVGFVVVNSLLSPVEWRYTVAHEIGHLVMEREKQRHHVFERLADMYACGILMPEPRIIKQVCIYGSDPRTIAILNNVPVYVARAHLFRMVGVLANHLNNDPLYQDLMAKVEATRQENALLPPAEEVFRQRQQANETLDNKILDKEQFEEICTHGKAKIPRQRHGHGLQARPKR